MEKKCTYSLQKEMLLLIFSHLFIDLSPIFLSLGTKMITTHKLSHFLNFRILNKDDYISLTLDSKFIISTGIVIGGLSSSSK